MMKILLLQPPIRDFYDTDVRRQPVGLGYLKAAILKHVPDVVVTLKDYRQGWGRQTVPVPDELKFLEPYYSVPDKSPFSLFHRFYHYGAAYETLAWDVAEAMPDLVGISSLFSPYYREVLETAAAIKTRIGAPIVIGGPHASALPETLMESPHVDFVVTGEGERPLVRLIEAMRKKRSYESVPNLVYRAGGSIRRTHPEAAESIDNLPMPDFSDFPANRYTYEGRPLSVILTSRGCPYRCDFCSVHGTFPGPYRRRTNADVLDEIRVRHAQGIRVFDFEDDHLTHDCTAATELFSAIAEEYADRPIRLLAMNGIAYWTLDDELLALMKKAGFTHLNLSLVSYDAEILKSQHRPFDLEKHRRMVQKAFQLGMKVVSYQILGLPGETIPSTIEGLVYAARLPLLLGASPFYLPPGSPLFESMSGPGHDCRVARLTALGAGGASLPLPSIYTFLITVRIINFLKGIGLSKNQNTLDDALRAARRTGKRSGLGAELLEMLIQSGELYAATTAGRVKLTAFQSDVFSEVWKRLGYIQTQEGRRLNVE
jgi:radical SAM superfamily enzyme YgiQ (UPF0313 family)